MYVNVDMIHNGQGRGEVANMLSGCRFDPGYLRPYIDSKGQRCITVNAFKPDSKGNPTFRRRLIGDVMAEGLYSPVFNATSLRKEEWIKLDDVVLKEARKRLRAWSDLAAANTYGGFDGMSNTILEHETMSDPGEAFIDFDGLTEGANDAPLFQLRGLPLPIIHSDFYFSSRTLAVSRNKGTPLNVEMAEAAARRVAETVEKMTIGTLTGPTYGGGSATPAYDLASTVFGYTNYTNRVVKTDLTTPTGSNAASTISDVLEMRDLLYAQNFFGPYMLYHSTDWDQFLDNDYILTGGNVATQTLRDRLRAIEGISDVRRLDYLTASTNPFTLILVSMDQAVARAVNGMDITTVQWESKGGMQLNFKVMCIMVPQLRSTYSGLCGICHATTS